MATQSSISVRGSSEQKVPSVRKGGRGGGGNRNSGGGPGHSGHSVLSNVSSSSILHLSVLKTTRKINARLILLTELLIGAGRMLYLGQDRAGNLFFPRPARTRAATNRGIDFIPRDRLNNSRTVAFKGVERTF